MGATGWTIAAHFRPSSISIRTNTSVMVSCKPGNSMRLPARAFGPPAIHRRSTNESASSWTSGSRTFLTLSGSLSMTGRRMPASTGVRHSTLNSPGAISLVSRYAGRASCAEPGTATSIAAASHIMRVVIRLTAETPRPLEPVLFAGPGPEEPAFAQLRWKGARARIRCTWRACPCMPFAMRVAFARPATRF